MRPTSRQGSEQATVQACVAKVLGMIKAGQLPAPEANFKLTSVAYDPRFFNDRYKTQAHKGPRANP